MKERFQNFIFRYSYTKKEFNDINKDLYFISIQTIRSFAKAMTLLYLIGIICDWSKPYVKVDILYMMLFICYALIMKTSIRENVLMGKAISYFFL